MINLTGYNATLIVKTDDGELIIPCIVNVREQETCYGDNRLIPKLKQILFDGQSNGKWSEDKIEDKLTYGESPLKSVWNWIILEEIIDKYRMESFKRNSLPKELCENKHVMVPTPDLTDGPIVPSPDLSVSADNVFKGIKNKDDTLFNQLSNQEESD